jgi:hypothetical protein
VVHAESLSSDPIDRRDRSTACGAATGRREQAAIMTVKMTLTRTTPRRHGGTEKTIFKRQCC